MNHTWGFSTKIWASSFYSLIFLTDTSITTQQAENNFHTPAHSIPEMAWIICFVIISRSSSDRCARLSIRAERVWGTGSCLLDESLPVLARSFCSILDSLASPAAEDTGEEAALDASSAAISANAMITFPDMSACKKKERLLVKSHVLLQLFEKLDYCTCEDEICSLQSSRGVLLLTQIWWLWGDQYFYTTRLEGEIWLKIKEW